MTSEEKQNKVLKMAQKIIKKQQKHQKKHTFGDLLRSLFVPYLLGLGERMETQPSFTDDELAQVYHSIWEHVITEEEWEKGGEALDNTTIEQWQKVAEEIISPVIQWEKKKKKELQENNS